MNTCFRKAEECDLEHLVAIDRLARSPQRVDYIRHAIEAGACAVVEVDGEALGYGVLTYTFYGNGMIELIYVREDRRRSGIGGALVDYLSALCRTPKLFTSTNASNTPMQQLLAKHGFEPSGRIDNLDAGDPELVYYKQVT